MRTAAALDAASPKITAVARPSVPAPAPAAPFEAPPPPPAPEDPRAIRARAKAGFVDAHNASLEQLEKMHSLATGLVAKTKVVAEIAAGNATAADTAASKSTIDAEFMHQARTWLKSQEEAGAHPGFDADHAFYTGDKNHNACMSDTVAKLVATYAELSKQAQALHTATHRAVREGRNEGSTTFPSFVARGTCDDYIIAGASGADTDTELNQKTLTDVVHSVSMELLETFPTVRPLTMHLIALGLARLASTHSRDFLGYFQNIVRTHVLEGASSSGDSELADQIVRTASALLVSSKLWTLSYPPHRSMSVFTDAVAHCVTPYVRALLFPDAEAFRHDQFMVLLDICTIRTTSGANSIRTSIPFLVRSSSGATSRHTLSEAQVRQLIARSDMGPGRRVQDTVLNETLSESAVYSVIHGLCAVSCASVLIPPHPEADTVEERWATLTNMDSLLGLGSTNTKPGDVHGTHLWEILADGAENGGIRGDVLQRLTNADNWPRIMLEAAAAKARRMM